MPMVKPVSVGGSVAVARSTQPSAFKDSHPTLWGYLTDGTWDDGSARRTSTLTVFIEDGIVKLCLNDRDLGRTAWVTGATMEDAVDVLELRLMDDNAEWRRSYDGPKRKAR